MFNQSKPREAIEKYTSDTYIQHNPEMPDGKQGFIAFFEKMAKDYPGKRVEFRRVFAEGKHVVLHGGRSFPVFSASRSGPASTSFASTTTARSSSTRMWCRRCRAARPTATRCFERARSCFDWYVCSTMRTF